MRDSRCYYAGTTGFFTRRVAQHKSGSLQGFTNKYNVDRLLYYEVYSDVGQAKRRELQKGWRREKKIKQIEKMNPAGRIWPSTGPGNGVQGTIARENSLTSYSGVHILGILRLPLSLPLRGILRSRSGLARVRGIYFSFFNASCQLKPCSEKASFSL